MGSGQWIVGSLTTAHYPLPTFLSEIGRYL
ncbi:protein of unknown function [Candidatus Promineifilum breve]|uniref:Uncharacterized protein n=1 Tax=Candidatus Promineifilum breve TaxID=1806508 RepID=A0A160T7D7_9CHLR|nr:protein of unknown function [Candidatus Promineifilum breve]